MWEGSRGVGWPQQQADGTQRDISTVIVSVSWLDLIPFENHSEKRFLQGLGTDAWKPSSCMPRSSERATHLNVQSMTNIQSTGPRGPWGRSALLSLPACICVTDSREGPGEHLHIPDQNICRSRRAN